MRFFQMDGPFWNFMNKAGNILFTGGLCLVFSLPVITSGAAVCACHHTMVKAVRKEEGYVWNTFLASFRENVRTAMKFTLVFLLAGILFAAGAWMSFFGMMRPYFFTVYGILLFLLAGTSIYFFAILSKFQMQGADVLKLSFYLMIRYLPFTLLLLGIIMVSFFMIWLMPVLTVVMPGVTGYVNSFLLEMVFDKHVHKNKA